MSLRRIAPASSRGSMPDSTDNASFGPMPLTAINFSNIIELEIGRKTVERELILAHVRVNPQRDRRAGIAAAVKRRQRHLHVVADAGDIDDHAIRMLFEDLAAEARDHLRWPVIAPGLEA